MKYFPIFLDLENQEVLVVGGGEQAVQKVRLLVRTTARIVVVVEEPNAELRGLEADGRIEVRQRRFQSSDVGAQGLIYAATGDAALDSQVATAARHRRVPVNVVDTPRDCSFITPAIIDRDPVVVAIGTEGMAPIIARQIKSKLEVLLPTRLGHVAKAAGQLRGRIAKLVSDAARRRQLWERLLAGRFSDRLIAGDVVGAHDIANREIAAVAQDGVTPGSITLVGCGPGDPDLLTLKAVQVLQAADTLVIDRLVDPRVLDYARRDAKRIFVGKVPGGPSTDQNEINRNLVREALLGRKVARLKGGDPSVFGRAVEELMAARAAGIDVAIVPGITAAHAASASIGLPLTLRATMQQFTILTGASADGDLDHDWHALARAGHGFAIYMGVRTAPILRRKLLAAGAAADTPVIVVENASRENERVVATSLADMAEAIQAHGVHGPAIIFVGLDWAQAGLSPPAGIARYAKPQLSALPLSACEVSGQAVSTSIQSPGVS